MLTPAKPNPGTPAAPPVRIIQAAEMTDTVGSKAIFTVAGILFTSLMPETPAEAQKINATIHDLGAK